MCKGGSDQIGIIHYITIEHPYVQAGSIYTTAGYLRSKPIVTESLLSVGGGQSSGKNDSTGRMGDDGDPGKIAANHRQTPNGVETSLLKLSWL